MNQAFQVAMARLYTEPAVRHALYRGDATAFEAGELSPNQVAALQKFACDNRERLELYTGFLDKKKAKQPRKRLPVLSAALDAVMEEGWNRISARYHEGSPERGEASVQDGEPSLLAFVEAIAPTFGAGESLVRDALRYETIKRQLGLAADATAGDAPPRPGCPWVSRPFAMHAFRHDLLALVSGTQDRAGALRPSDTQVLFCRHPTLKSVSTARATKALGALVEACDGRTPLAELAAVLKRAGVARASESSVAAAVAELVRAGLLGMTKAEQAQ